MTGLLRIGVAAVACAAVFDAARPAAGEYCYRSARSYMLSCDYATLAQCQASASGRSGDCLRDPWAREAATASARAPMARRHRRN